MDDTLGTSRGVDERPGVGRLFGRDSHVSLLERLLDDARRFRGGALVLRGEPGSGKSALLDLMLGRASGFQVLRVVGVEPESELAFAALHRLLRPILSYVDRIPDVQATALRIAMGMAGGKAENRFVIDLAVLSLLSEAAVDEPVLCLIDDAQWLDQPTADALAFVARRLEAEGIVLLFSVRDGDAGSFPGAGLAELALAGLDASEADELLLDRFGGGVAAQVRREIVEAARGLPLALHEIPGALTDAQLAGDEPLPRPMPMGNQLADILLERVRRLPAPVQLLLLVAAADGPGEAEVVLAAASALGISSLALLDAEASGLIRSEGTLLVFRHPLLRSAIYDGASLPQRQAVHRSLVDVLTGEANADRRAWHRAALVLYPDDEIADELTRIAERARSRGGHAAAAGALRRAAELTSSDDRRARRLVAAARAAWDAGLPDEASVLLRSIETEEDVATFAEASHVQGEIEFNCGAPLRGAAVLMEGAERVAATDPRKALEMLFDAAQCANYAGDPTLMIEAGRRASMLPVRRMEPESTLVDLLTAMLNILVAKDTRDRGRLPEMLDRVDDIAEPRWLVWAGAAAAVAGDHERDEAFRRRAESIARRSMAVGSLTLVLARVAWNELFTKGRLTAAANHAEEGLRLTLETGLTNAASLHRAVLAWIAAVRGDEGTCLSLAEQASHAALEHGIAVHNATANWAVGLLHLGLGRWGDAAARLESVWSFAPGTGHPHIAMLALPDLVEAWVRVGRLELAAPGVVRLGEYVGDVAPGRLIAISTRCQALVAETPESKEKFLREAVAFHDLDPRPLDRARTLLLLGEHLRRERRRAEARVPLRAALDAFDQLGAVPWADRARRELRASGQRVRRRVDVSSTELTLQERQVAALVAEGATNKEVAAQLFLSPRTVEYHLRNVFGKLQISSRGELAQLRLNDARPTRPP